MKLHFRTSLSLIESYVDFYLINFFLAYEVLTKIPVLEVSIVSLKCVWMHHTKTIERRHEHKFIMTIKSSDDFGQTNCHLGLVVTVHFIVTSVLR